MSILRVMMTKSDSGTTYFGAFLKYPNRLRGVVTKITAKSTGGKIHRTRFRPHSSTSMRSITTLSLLFFVLFYYGEAAPCTDCQGLGICQTNGQCRCFSAWVSDWHFGVGLRRYRRYSPVLNGTKLTDQCTGSKWIFFQHFSFVRMRRSRNKNG